jgi:hypothetical protein
MLMPKVWEAEQAGDNVRPLSGRGGARATLDRK